MSKIHFVSQGTPAWMQLRAGIPTASCFSEIMTAGKKKSESQEPYINHLLAERILGRPLEGYKSQAMDDGNRFEENAVAAFEFKHDVTTEPIGFVTTDDNLVGCSPDRFIKEWPDVMLEVKAPSSAAVHVSYLRAATGAMKKYLLQVMGELWVCEKSHVDIISYFPGLPDATFRVSRDEEFIKELSAFVRAFSGRLEEITEDFKARGWIKDAPLTMEEAEDRFASAEFLTQEDQDIVLRDAFPEMFNQPEQQHHSR